MDGQRLEAKDGNTIIQTAYENGIEIPHFCWHPELSVSGNCRMCLVEVGLPKRLPDGTIETDTYGNPTVNYFPKLQIACATYVSDGMHVRTKTPKAIEAQEAVMEFILINHPLDCPICDEAGQCKLQDYAFNYSNGKSRFEENKNPNPKRQVWGPNVLFDAERCISCSRCIRFAQEVAKQDVLTFVNRGDHVTIELFEGTTFDNPYSMNVIDICPVGALTSPDFRFKSRVWDMSFNDSICTSCGKGCNVKLGIRNNEILRLEPKTNMQVNKYWMCDHGRLSYEYVNKNRVTKPLIKDESIQKEVDWKEALNFAAYQIKRFKPNEVFVLISPNLSNEDLYISKKFAANIVMTTNYGFLTNKQPNFADDLLKVADRNANSVGAELIGLNNSPKGIQVDELLDNIINGSIRALYLIGEDLEDHAHLIGSLEDIELLIVNAPNHNKVTEIADLVLPMSTHAEIEGTFTNVNKLVQYVAPAITTKENLRFMGMKMSRLDKLGAKNDRWTQHEERNSRQTWRILQSIANLLDTNWSYRSSKEIFNDLTQAISEFSGMSYNLLKEYNGLQCGQNRKLEKDAIHYRPHRLKPN